MESRVRHKDWRQGMVVGGLRDGDFEHLLRVVGVGLLKVSDGCDSVVVVARDVGILGEKGAAMSRFFSEIRLSVTVVRLSDEPTHVCILYPSPFFK